MRFTKMHGIGNDYVYINCLREKVEDPEHLARFVSSRHFGVGSDGLILICPSKTADFRMDMYNADGSRGEMCGNGIRCVGKYVYDYGLTDKTDLTIETLAGIKELRLFPEKGKVARVRVNMGAPILEPEKIPVLCRENPAVNVPIVVGEKEYRMTCVSMGNPHAVVFAEGIRDLDLASLGPRFENHPCFPNRINTEFVEVEDENTVSMRVWERGSGETMACGTGACAAAVACILNKKTNDSVLVRLLGGDLEIEWDRAADRIFMTGAAAAVFDGELLDF